LGAVVPSPVAEPPFEADGVAGAGRESPICGLDDAGRASPTLGRALRVIPASSSATSATSSAVRPRSAVSSL